MGREDAWDHFVKEFRPAMYRAADAIDPGGGAREIAQALYAELFGLKEKDGIRQSVFRYFHGRSSLTTWLRSLISQRFVDRHRETRRLDPLPDESSAAPLRASSAPIDPDRARFVAAMRAVLAAAIAALEPRDRLRLACYYAEEMTLAADRHADPRARGHGVATTGEGPQGHPRRRRAAAAATRGVLESRDRRMLSSIVDDAGNLDLERLAGATGTQEICSRSFYD